jgi:hypothetical protein
VSRLLAAAKLGHRAGKASMPILGELEAIEIEDGRRHGVGS